MMAEASPETNPHSLENEQVIILRSYCDTVVPKLISDDSPLLKLLIKGVFPTANVPPIENAELLLHLKQECERKFLMFSNEKFIEKVLQLQPDPQTATRGHAGRANRLRQDVLLGSPCWPP
jgi:hypothetical protein